MSYGYLCSLLRAQQGPCRNQLAVSQALWLNLAQVELEGWGEGYNQPQTRQHPPEKGQEVLNSQSPPLDQQLVPSIVAERICSVL